MMLMALGASVYYNYYLSTLRIRDKKKSKKLDKENRMLQYNLQRTQQQMEGCMAEKKNGRISVKENNITPTIRTDVRTQRPNRSSLRYVSPAVGTASVLKRGVN